MSRLRLLPLLLLLVSPRAWAAIAFDATAGHSGQTGCASSPCSVTITIVAGETAFCSVLVNTSGTLSITGGGTWTIITNSAPGFNAGAEMALLTNGAGGGSAASSISVSASVAEDFDVACAQYSGVGALSVISKTTANTAGQGFSIVQVASTALVSWVVAGLVTSQPSFTASIGNLRVQNSADITGTVGINDNTLASGLGTVTNEATTSSNSAGQNEAMGIELYPSGSYINFDPASGHAAVKAATTTSPLSVPITIVSGETGFCAVAFDGTIAGDSVTGITGGGTWTLVKPKNAAASARSELWSNGVNGGSTASSISIAFTGTVVDVSAACTQYKGAMAICTSNAVSANGTTGPTISLTTVNANDFVIAALADVGTSPTMTASTGVLRETTANTVLSCGLNDNGSTTAAAVTNAVAVTTSADWAANAVELSLLSSCGGTPGWMSWGFGQ